MSLTAAEWAAFAAVATVALTAIVHILKTRPDLRKVEAETQNIQAETESTKASTVAKLLEELEAQRARLAAQDERERTLTHDLDATCEQLADLIARVTFIEMALPAVVISSKLKTRTESMLRVLNRCRDGIVLTAPSNGGAIIWCNESFAAALGRTPDDVVTRGWKALVHPGDAESTSTAEASAWSGGGEIVNRYLHSDGHWITMRWHFTLYEDGFAFSVVHFDRRNPDAGGLTF